MNHMIQYKLANTLLGVFNLKSDIILKNYYIFKYTLDGYVSFYEIGIL